MILLGETRRVAVSVAKSVSNIHQAGRDNANPARGFVVVSVDGASAAVADDPSVFRARRLKGFSGQSLKLRFE